MSDKNKTLASISHHIYYMENKDKIYESQKKWRKNNPDKVREMQRKHYDKIKNTLEYKQKQREKDKKHYEKHKEEILLKRRERYLKNKLQKINNKGE